MSEAEWSLQDAKNKFSAVVDAARNGQPQTVTKRGEPAVVVVAVEEYERLVHKKTKESASFVEHLLAMPKDDGNFDSVSLQLRDLEF